MKPFFFWPVTGGFDASILQLHCPWWSRRCFPRFRQQRRMWAERRLHVISLDPTTTLCPLRIPRSWQYTNIYATGTRIVDGQEWRVAQFPSLKLHADPGSRKTHNLRFSFAEWELQRRSLVDCHPLQPPRSFSGWAPSLPWLGRRRPMAPPTSGREDAVKWNGKNFRGGSVSSHL